MISGTSNQSYLAWYVKISATLVKRNKNHKKVRLSVCYYKNILLTDDTIYYIDYKTPFSYDMGV